MAVVIKRDGTQEPFDRNKLIRCLKSAGAEEDIALEIAEGLETDLAEQLISSDDIRELIEDDLNYYDSNVLKRFNTFCNS